MSAMIEDQVSTLVPGMGGGFLDEDKRFNVTDAYVVSVSYQLSWRRWDFRVGGGSSPQPLAWTLQANDVSYRFGGRTRRTEAKSKKGWRRNKGDVTRKKDTEPAS